MTKDEKLTRLLEMQEHPDRYTEEEIRQLMADEECRQLYNAMVRATDAIFMEKLNGQGVEPEASPSKPSTLLSFSPVLRKIAAVAIGVLMLSGIAYAAIRMLKKSEVAAPKTDNVELAVAPPDTIVSQPQPQPADSLADAVRIFQDVPLDDMLREMAGHYQKELVVNSEAAHALRLYYKWNRTDSLDRVVADLNHFDRVHLAVENGKLIVKP